MYTVNYNTWYTVCIFIETKTDKYDILNIPDGFSYVAKNRKIFKHKSGGIVVVCKNYLKNHIKFKYLIMTFYWDVYYTLPENSLYSSINAFLDIENEWVNFIEKDMKCALVGDFNAKAGVFFKIFSEPDETFLNVMDVNVEDGLFRYHIAMTTKFYLILIFP